ncbi:MAG: hypothetical protein WA117_19190 [Verrucomicrobiia bacterium]
MKTSRYPQPALSLLCPMILSLALAGCMSVQLIADYDQKIDDGVTALQKKTETFLVALERTCETPEGAYARHVPFYDEVKVDLAALQVRADAIARNSLTSQQIQSLRDSIAKMEAQHKQGLRPIVIAETRKILNSEFTAILALEVAKKKTPTSK